MLITMEQVLQSAFIAFIATIMIVGLQKILKPENINIDGIEISKSSLDLNQLMQKCYTLFPLESIYIKDTQIIRGMTIRIMTSGEKIIEGKLIGANKENILCILTTKYIVAQGLTSIEDVTILDEKR